MKRKTGSLIALKDIFLLSGIAMLAYSGLVLYVAKPWIIVTEVRVSNQLDDVKTSLGVGCEEEFFSEMGIPGHLTLCFPQGALTPWDTDAGVRKNAFKIRGYRHKEIHRNVFSGVTEERPSGRIDVVEWNVTIPYEVMVREGDTYSSRTVVEPMGWKVDQAGFNEMKVENPGQRERMKCVKEID